METSQNSLFSKITLDKLDQMFGLRAWGLILYGALPASLSLLGIVDIKVGQISNVLPMLVVSLLPFLVTFLLVRARQREWYFTTDYLNLRSIVTTVLIVVSATLISGASGIIRNKYRFAPFDLADERQQIALAESFLFGMASLVFSSSLFATILTKGADLPGLPASGFVSCIGKIRQQLIAIQNSSIWQNYDSKQGTQIFDDLKAARDNIRKELEVALSQPGNKLAKRGLAPLSSELDVFATSVTHIRDGKIQKTIEYRWTILFGDLSTAQAGQIENLMNEREAIMEQYATLKKLKSLRLGG